MNAVTFSCPECGNKLALEAAAVIDHDVHFMANCHRCKASWRFTLERILKELMPTMMSQGSTAVN